MPIPLPSDLFFVTFFFFRTFHTCIYSSRPLVDIYNWLCGKLKKIKITSPGTGGWSFAISDDRESFSSRGINRASSINRTYSHVAYDPYDSSNCLICKITPINRLILRIRAQTNFARVIRVTSRRSDRHPRVSRVDDHGSKSIHPPGRVQAPKESQAAPPPSCSRCPTKPSLARERARENVCCG